MKIYPIVSGTPAHCHDLSKISSLCLQDSWTSSDFFSEIHKENAVLLVALEEDTPVGYLSASLWDSCYIHSIGVLPHYQNQQIGGQLLSHLYSLCLPKAIQKIYLEVRCSNSMAQNFYQNHGFINLLQKSNLYQNPKEDGYLFEKIID